MSKVRLVLFDAFSTLLVPRLPVYVQYSQTFEPYFGVLEPNDIKSSFKTALKQLQTDKPAYKSGADAWWGEVIRRTAIGAGADPTAVELHLENIVPKLLTRFSSREGYRLFDDSLPCLKGLKSLNVRTGLVSNTDARMRKSTMSLGTLILHADFTAGSVIGDLGIASYLDPILLSEEEGVEKPSVEIFQRACDTAGVELDEVLHVGDELKADYYGAKGCGLKALLVRRHGEDGESEMKENEEDLSQIEAVSSLQQVVEWVKQNNSC
ncbi:HAD hydrolase subfamily IA REG-2-like protein [Cytidiella melzeri]|nr:HAD hydrolase subfamily IA REG-2-like protein [Cytidiella melzeri]